jgi:hypothetical protein
MGDKIIEIKVFKVIIFTDASKCKLQNNEMMNLYYEVTRN